MTQDDLIFEQIENFLSDKMPDQEKQAFQKQLAVDPKLQEKVEHHQLINDLVIENRLLQVNNVLLDTHHGNSNTMGFPKTIALVAVAGFMCAGGVWSYLSKKSEITKNSKAEIITQVPKTDVVAVLPKSNVQGQQKDALEPSFKNNTIIPQSQTKAKSNNSGENNFVTPSKVENVKVDDLAKLESKTKTNAMPQTEPAIVPIIVKGLCEGIVLASNFTVVATCDGDETGSISLKSCTGGVAPYKVNLFDKNGDKLSSNYNLQVGEYLAIIQDAKGCQSKQELLVPKKDCAKDYVFNPFNGVELEIPLAGKSGVISIQDRLGVLYAQFTFSDETVFKWNGLSKNGDIKEGFYNFAIEYTDKSISIGTISIVR